MKNPNTEQWMNSSIANIAYYAQLLLENPPNLLLTILVQPPLLPAHFPSLIINIMLKSDPAAKFVKGVKRLPNSFLELKEDGKWYD